MFYHACIDVRHGWIMLNLEMSLLIISNTTLRPSHDGIALTPPPPDSRHNSRRTRHPSIICSYRRQDNDGREVFYVRPGLRTYVLYYPYTDCGNRSPRSLSRCAPRTYCNWTIIRWGRAALRCSARRIIAFIRILYDFC